MFTRLLKPFLITLLLGSFSIATADDEFDYSTLEQVPHPVMDDFDAEVRQRIEANIRIIEQQQGGVPLKQLSESYGILGMIYHGHQLLDAAFAAYRNAAKLNPEDTMWHYVMADVHYRNGDIDKAIENYLVAVNTNPAYMATYVHLGQLYLEKGKVTEAEMVFKQSVQSEEHKAASLEGLGMVAMKRQKFEEAVAIFEEVLKMDPEAVSVHYQLGLAYRQLKNIDKAKYHLALRGKKTVNYSDPLMEAVSVTSTTSLESYLRLVIDMMTDNNMERAIMILDEALNKYPENVRLLTMMGSAKELTGETSEAEMYYLKAEESDPNFVMALSRLSDFYKGQNQLDKSISYLERAVALEPEDAVVFMKHGDAMLNRGEFNKAIASYSQARMRFNDSIILPMNMALAYLAKGDCDKGIEAQRKAMSMVPNQGQIILALARSLAVCPNSSDEQKRQALQYAEMVYNASPMLETAEVYAMTLAATGNFNEAIDLQTQAIFEALKSGILSARPSLQENMQRYRNGEAAKVNWQEVILFEGPDSREEEQAS